MGFFAPLLGISINTTGLSASNNGLFSLTMIGLLKAAEASSKLLTANQSEPHRYTTIGMASTEHFKIKSQVTASNCDTNGNCVVGQRNS